MVLQERINAFAKLGQFICEYLDYKSNDELDKSSSRAEFVEFQELISSLKHHNGWFTEHNVDFTLKAWCKSLRTEQLQRWLAPYEIDSTIDRTIAIIMAGNIPLVGFHDFLSVLLSGHRVLVRQSSNDKMLLPFLVEQLKKIEPRFNERIEVTQDKLQNFDAVIATGSDNTARYFEFYFKDKPSIIRRNRNSIAILNGTENDEQLAALSNDIFRYYGLGCRNVSKIFVPKEFNFDPLFNAFFKWRDIINENKYANNYDYNKAVYLMSQYDIKNNGFIILKQDESYTSPIATLFYEFYESDNVLKNRLHEDQNKIQCIVSSGFLKDEVAFGQTQNPKLCAYADNIDTIEFLSKIT